MAMQRAERFQTELLRRGVLLVPVIWGEGQETKLEKKGFGLKPKAAEALSSIGVTVYHLPSSILLFIQSFCFFDEMTLTHKTLLGRF